MIHQLLSPLFVAFLFLITVDAQMHPGVNNAINNPLHDKKQVQDQAHMREHLEGITDKKPEDMTEQEMQFHYFKLHDTDGNNKLDGLELLHAITHYHGEMPGPEGQRVLPDTELAMTIDAILADDDKNGDGYIDYTEFMTRQGP